MRSGLKSIIRHHNNGTAVRVPARTRTATSSAKRAVLTNEFAALVRSFSALLNAAIASRTPGRGAFAPGTVPDLPSPGAASSPAAAAGRALVAASTPARRGFAASPQPINSLAHNEGIQLIGNMFSRSLDQTERALREVGRTNESLAVVVNANASLLQHLGVHPAGSPRRRLASAAHPASTRAALRQGPATPDPRGRSVSPSERRNHTRLHAASELDRSGARSAQRVHLQPESGDGIDAGLLDPTDEESVPPEEEEEEVELSDDEETTDNAQ